MKERANNITIGIVPFFFFLIHSLPIQVLSPTDVHKGGWDTAPAIKGATVSREAGRAASLSGCALGAAGTKTSLTRCSLNEIAKDN